MGTTKKAILIIIICTILTSLAQILFKFGSASFSFNPILLMQNYFVVFGFLSYALGALLLILALKEGELSTLYPFFATSYIWVLILSFLLFGESITFFKISGIFLIIIGVSCIGAGSKK